MHIEQLIVVAGPSGCGKSTLIRNLQAGNLPALAAQIEMDSSSLWTCITTKKLRQLHTAQIARLILHYDLVQVWKQALFKNHGKYSALDILDTSDKTTLVTVWTSPHVLFRRFQSRQISTGKSLLRRFKFRRLGYLIKVSSYARWLYARPPELVRQYEKWFEFCSTRPIRSHWLIDTTPDVPVWMDIARWPDLLEHLTLAKVGERDARPNLRKGNKGECKKRAR